MNLGTERISKLLWQLSVPAILGMLSSAIFNIVDRIFVGRIGSDALTAVGITMPVQIIQMAFVLLVGIGSSALVSLKLGEGRKDEAEDVLFLALKYIIIFLIAFALLFMVFLDPILSILSISDNVLPYAKEYIIIIIIGSIIGIPGYCLNNSLRSIGKAGVSMRIIIISSVMNIILDPIFIYGFRMGIGGAAIATVISQTTLTVYVIYAFIRRQDFIISLRLRRVKHELGLLGNSLRLGMPSFYIQILAAAVNLFINKSLLKFGSDLDIAAFTIMASIYSFYHMVVVGIVQGNNAICGYNWGARQYARVRRSVELALFYSFLLSLLLFIIILLFPGLLVSVFSDEGELIEITSVGIRYYLCMLPIIGPLIVSTQYFQVVDKTKVSNILAFLRYGIIIIPSILLLAPSLGIKGIYISNGLSDGISGVVAGILITLELIRLRKMESNVAL